MDDPGDDGGDARPERPSLRHRVSEGTSARVASTRQWARRYEHVPVVDVLAATLVRDQESAGAVMGSAVAFRLFLFFVPLLLLFVGIAGVLTGYVGNETLSRAAGVSGNLANQMSEAFHQGGVARWLAVFFGLTGALWAGRSLSRVLMASSAAAWRLTGRRRAHLRTAGAIAGLACGIALIAIGVNRIREAFGLGAAGLSFLPALAIYAVTWMAVSLLLPRGTEDPGAVLPGALLVAATLAGMQAFSELYLPERLSRASQLYGEVGATIVTLGWFFILGRAIVVGMELNAAIYERYGSISQVVFALPLLRSVAARSPRIRRFFDLPGGP
jgi:uncharacterized BrkB/YihY/UPF0761 family membrane protein